jgi:uncharacterized repeat protein (TIGR01451 family)
LASAEIYDPALGTWSPTASMSIVRGQHTATLLSDGRVLVSGGPEEGGISPPPPSSAEIYDPVLGTWSLTGPMSADHRLHTATLLPDGRVLVSGGFTFVRVVSASAEIFDPALGTWSLTGSMSAERAQHTATLLPDGRVLVSGGRLASAEIYDPALGTWSLTASMNTSRSRHTATLLPDGRVLVSGGAESSAGEEVFSSGVTPAGDVRIRLSAPHKITPGGTLTYTMTIKNASKTPATGVVVSNPIPAGTAFAGASASQGTVAAPAVGSNGTVTVNLGSLARRATATITVVVTVTAASGTILTETATVTATTQDLKSRNNSATQHTKVVSKK